MKEMHRALLVVAFLATPAISVMAAPATKHKPLQEGAPYTEQRQHIVDDLQKGDVYSEIKAEDQARVLAALARIDAKLINGERANLSEADKLAVFNDQELVNTVLTQAREDSRLICKRERVVGSNMPQRVCITVAERRRARENSTDALRSLQTLPSKANTP
jgi:hypothetical protein